MVHKQQLSRLTYGSCLPQPAMVIRYTGGMLKLPVFSRETFGSAEKTLGCEVRAPFLCKTLVLRKSIIGLSLWTVTGDTQAIESQRKISGLLATFRRCFSHLGQDGAGVFY